MRVGIIIGSIRDVRLGERVGKWVLSEAGKVDGWEVEVLDVKTANLPLYHDAMQPYAMDGKYPESAVTKWSGKVRGCDAFLFITPEYNHGLPAPLKNAIDWLYPEWNDKAAGIISYSNGVGGGIRASEQLRQTLAHTGVATVQTNCTIPFADKNISPEGMPAAEGFANTLKRELDQLDKWASALSTIRS